MKKYLLAVLAVLAVSLGVAPAAQAYPDAVMTLSLSDSTVVSGASFSVSATSDVNCSFDATFNGATRTGTGTTFNASFTAPTVDQREVIPVTVTCTQSDGTTTSRSANVTVLPPASQGAGASSALPSTGGPNVGLLGAALALLLGGVGFLVVSRRRRRTTTH